MVFVATKKEAMQNALITLALLLPLFAGCQRSGPPREVWTPHESGDVGYQPPPPFDLRDDPEAYYERAQLEMADTRRTGARVDAMITLQQGLQKDPTHLPCHELYQDLRADESGWEAVVEDYRVKYGQNRDDPLFFYLWLRALMIGTDSAPDEVNRRLNDAALSEAQTLLNRAEAVAEQRRDNTLTLNSELWQCLDNAIELAPAWPQAHIVYQDYALAANRKEGLPRIEGSAPLGLDALRDRYQKLATGPEGETSGNAQALHLRLLACESSSLALEIADQYARQIAFGMRGLWLFHEAAAHCLRSATLFESAADQRAMRRAAQLLYELVAAAPVTGVWDRELISSATHRAERLGQQFAK